MSRIYIAALGGAAFLLLFFYGVRIGTDKCRSDMMSVSLRANNQIAKQMDEINAETMLHNTGTIRGILRERYTIGE